jgi:hypothetical protein
MFVLESLLRLFYEYPLLTVGILLAAGYIVASLHKIGPTEVGLITKRFSSKKLTKDNPVAFNGEAGYQADLLMPGLRWKAFLIYSVEKYPWVQVPAGEIGVVIAQVGSALPIGAKSAVYKKEFGNFSDLRHFLQLGVAEGRAASGVAARLAGCCASFGVPDSDSQPRYTECPCRRSCARRWDAARD